MKLAPEKARDARRRMVLLRWVAEQRRKLHHAWDPDMTPRRVRALSESIQSAMQEVVGIERRWPELRDPPGAGGVGTPPGESPPEPTSAHGKASDIHAHEAGTRGHTRPLPSPSPGSEATPPGHGTCLDPGCRECSRRERSRRP